MLRTDIRRLETAALRHKPETLARQLERLLGLSQTQAHRIISDELGEPIVVTAKAMDLSNAVLQRLLSALSSCLGQWADRVHELTELYREIGREAAPRFLGIWPHPQH